MHGSVLLCKVLCKKYSNAQRKAPLSYSKIYPSTLTFSHPMRNPMCLACVGCVGCVASLAVYTSFAFLVLARVSTLEIEQWKQTTKHWDVGLGCFSLLSNTRWRNYLESWNILSVLVILWTFARTWLLFEGPARPPPLGLECLSPLHFLISGAGLCGTALR